MTGCIKTGEPLVDVLILTFGDYSRLGRTIDSILEQSCPIHSVVLSDDGSGKPFPASALQRLKQAYPDLRIRDHMEHLGTVAHMNAAAECCSGTYLKFIAAGDCFSDREALQSLLAFAQQAASMVVTSDAMVCSEDLQRQYYTFPGSRRGRCLQGRQQEQYLALLQSNLISAAGTLLRRDFFDVFGGFDESYFLLEDWPAWLRFTREHARIAYLPRVTCLYALGGISSKDGNAFDALCLRKDMLRCYEKEILPYLTLLPPKKRYAVQYDYARLSGAPKRTIFLRYFPFVIKDLIKRGGKWLIVNCPLTQNGHWSVF